MKHGSNGVGMRTKEPYGLQAGLMWFDPQRPNPLENIRHQAQDRDGMQLMYGFWLNLKSILQEAGPLAKAIS